MILAISSVFCVILYLLFEAMSDKISLKHAKYYFLGLLLCGIGMVLSHYYAYIFVFATGVVAFIFALKSKMYILPFVLTFGIMGLTGITWIGYHHFYGGFLNRMESAWTLDINIWYLCFAIILSALSKYGYIALALIFAFVLRDKQHRICLMCLCKKYAPLLYIVALELFIALIIYFFISETMTTRYFMLLYPLIYLFFATLLAHLAYKKYALAVLVCVLTASSALHSATYHKEDLRAASAYVRSHFSPQSCILPVGWVAYTRYLPEFSAIESPLLQTTCDLILLTAENADSNGDFPHTRALLAAHHITSHYKILSFNGAVVVIRE